jgi:thiol:disulfide interchange protein DsbC
MNVYESHALTISFKPTELSFALATVAIALALLSNFFIIARQHGEWHSSLAHIKEIPMIRTSIFAIALLIAIIPATIPAFAGTAPNPDAIQATIAKNFLRLSPNLVVKSVRPFAAIPGLYEVQVGNTIYYSGVSGEHLISGHIISTSTRKDLTKARMEVLNRIDWSVLPLDKAVVSGDKDGKLKLAVFTDPECPYCRDFEKKLAKLKGVQVYSFLFPLPFHKHARGWSSAIWCSKDQHKMMTDIMVNNADPKAGTCDTPIDEIIALGKKLGISGTPTMIAGDGRLASGVKDVDALKAWLESK